VTKGQVTVQTTWPVDTIRSRKIAMRAGSKLRPAYASPGCHVRPHRLHLTLKEPIRKKRTNYARRWQGV
jgi:hypothetical protein